MHVIKWNELAPVLGICVLFGGGCPVIIINAGSGTATEGDGSTTSGAPDHEPTTTAGPAACEAPRAAMLAVLEPNCGCHGEAAQGGFGSVLDPNLMVMQGFIKPGDPFDSPIYEETFEQKMPKGGPPLSDGELAVIKEYIECIEPVPGNPLSEPACEPTLHFTHANMIALINQDIFNLKADDRPFIRYLSLYHLVNAGYCDKAVLTSYVQALDKLVNSLSRENELRRLVAIPDSDGLIFRFDLRHYAWSKEVWDETACENPFAIDFGGNALLEEADAIRTATGAPIFVQPADAFLHIVSRPPFYYKYLQIPDNLDAFTAIEGVDIVAAVASEILDNLGDAARSGFFESGVANFNRIIEWYRIPGIAGEYCWISHDFYSNDGSSDVFEHPVDFDDAAREVICSLTNGLQIYLIVNAAGERLDVADPKIVTNVEHEGDAVVEGISCMGCHSDGLRLATDEVLPQVLSFPEDYPTDIVKATKHLYPPQEELDAIMDANMARFAQAMKDLDVPHRISTGATTSVEPIFLADLAFEEDIDLGRATGELGTTPDKLAGIQKLVPDVAKLFKPGGKMTRDEFAEVFPLAIQALQVGDGKPFEVCIDPG